MTIQETADALREQQEHEMLIDSAQFVNQHSLSELLFRLTEYTPCPTLYFVAKYARDLENNDE